MKKKKTLTASDAGRKGGKSTFNKLGSDHYRKIANMRWGKTKK